MFRLLLFASSPCLPPATACSSAKTQTRVGSHGWTLAAFILLVFAGVASPLRAQATGHRALSVTIGDRVWASTANSAIFGHVTGSDALGIDLMDGETK